MKNFPSKIFIDGGNPEETKEAKKLLGFIDGQTTNPTLIAKNPEVQVRLQKGEKFKKEELWDFYKKVVQEIAAIVDWSVSVEPYVDKNTSWQEILEQAQKMSSWSKKAWVKIPTTEKGLKAGQEALKQGIRVNFTLCFSQEQAAAVYSATRGAKKGEVFLSPFVGRLDDRGENGMQLIENILKMYEKGDGHVLTLTASVRSLAHLLYALKLKSPIVTVPFKVFKEWSETNFALPGEKFLYAPSDLTEIPYQELDLKKPWNSFNLGHELTDFGIEKFSLDWNSLVG